jgi:gas vesicle protein
MPTVLELYEKLKPKLGEEEARALLEFVETSVDRKAASKEDLWRTESALKEDLQRTGSALKEDLQRSESALKEDLQRTESSLREEIHRVESSLREEIQNVKVDLIKWSFAFWVGAIAVLSGLMFAMLRAFTGK